MNSFKSVKLFGSMVPLATLITLVTFALSIFSLRIILNTLFFTKVKISKNS